MDAATRKQTAETILQQLGGQRFIHMTGAKNIMFGAKGELTFQLPIGAWRFCMIELTVMDTYTVRFDLPRKMAQPGEQSKTFENAYAEDLRRIFEGATGLATKL
jgi:hypothetical protein